MNPLRTWVAVSCLALFACGDGQAGSDYRGEPLMSMKGVVTSSTLALNDGLVPMLVVREAAYQASQHGPTTTHFVQGEVQGTFPSAFTLRVYDPPPAASVHAPLDGEPGFAIAMLTATSPEHPAWLRAAEHDEMRANGDSVQRNELCSEDECISGYLSECPLGAQDPNAAWPCGSTFPEHLPWETYGYAQNHLVLYVAGAVAAGSGISKLFAGGAALGAGYHVLARDNAALLASGDCPTRARERALDTLNSANGTQWTSNDLAVGSVDPKERYKHEVSAFAAESCATGLAVVPDTTSAPVELQLIDQPTAGFFGL